MTITDTSHLTRNLEIGVELVSENAALIRFTFLEDKLNKSSQLVLPRIISLFRSELLKQLNTEKRIIIDSVPSYNTIVFTYDLLEINGKTFKRLCENCSTAILSSAIASVEKDITHVNSNIRNKNKVIQLPVYYGSDVAWDLEAISRQKKMTTQEVILLHSENIYTCCAIGFSPGFAYLGFVDEKIHHPRLSTPRKFVPKGSVGIAENQTGIYPSDSPGGWNIIGRSPSTIIDLNNAEAPCLFSIGDQIQFSPIDRSEYFLLGGKIEQ